MHKGMTFVMPSECQLRAGVTIDNVQRNTDYNGMLKEMLFNQMLAQMTNRITQNKVEEQIGEFTTKLRLEIFVFTHDELMKVIREQAQRYAREYERPTFGSP